MTYRPNMLSNAGDVCGRCGFLVREVYMLACRCRSVAGDVGIGHHLVHVCSCYFPRFEPLCADPEAQLPSGRGEYWAG